MSVSGVENDRSAENLAASLAGVVVPVCAVFAQPAPDDRRPDSPADHGPDQSRAADHGPDQSRAADHAPDQQHAGEARPDVHAAAAGHACRRRGTKFGHGHLVRKRHTTGAPATGTGAAGSGCGHQGSGIADRGPICLQSPPDTNPRVHQAFGTGLSTSWSVPGSSVRGPPSTSSIRQKKDLDAVPSFARSRVFVFMTALRPRRIEVNADPRQRQGKRVNRVCRDVAAPRRDEIKMLPPLGWQVCVVTKHKVTTKTQNTPGKHHR